jgi:hypothetical protein
MGTYYDYNYGHWDVMDDPDMVAFYHQTQKNNVRKKCQRCNRMVRIKPEYAICNACAEAIERGGEW